MPAFASTGVRNADARVRIQQGRIAEAITAVVVCAIHLPAFASVGLRTDTLAHLRFAESMALTGQAPGPYYLFEQLTIIARAAVPFNALALIAPSLGDRETIWEVSGVVVLLAFTAWLAVLVQQRLTAELSRFRAVRPSEEPTIQAQAIAGLLTVCLLMVAPVTVLTWARHQLLVGYISVTSFESATVIVARPLSLLLFWIVAERIWSKQSARMVAVTAVLSLLAVHAKPSYSVCLLPAASLLVLLNSTKRRRVDPVMWWVGFVLPTIAALGLQLVLARGQGGIGIAPFEVVQQMLHSRGLSGWWFIPLAAMSLLFPVAVVLIEPGVTRSSSLRLAWLAMLVGLTIFCVFTVTGRRDYGDLLWGPQIGLFVVFVESVRAIIHAATERLRKRPDSRVFDPRTSILSALFALHVMSGVMLWYHEVVTPAAWW